MRSRTAIDAEPLFPGATRLLLVDAPTGIAGDMFLAALGDLGFALDELGDALARAGLTGLALGLETVESHGLRGRRLALSGAEEEQPHRGLSDCLAIVDAMALPAAAAALAQRCLRRLAETEARLHGTTPEQVHFHELGALDSLVDIAGAALGLHRLGVGRLVLRDLAVGHGTAAMAHGQLPLPAPATQELLQGFPLREAGIAAELVTPTGALILAETAVPTPPGLRWRPEAVGYGAGSRTLPGRPNLLRLTLAAPVISANEPAWEAGLQHAQVLLLRCTLDDMNPERFSWLMEALLAAGALDVHYRPLQMKKNRPGLEVEVLAAEADASKLSRLLFEETTTLGLRIAREERLELPREQVELETPHGTVHMKVATLPDGSRRAAPEYEDCARLARERGLPLAEIEEAARAAWRRREERDAG
jgi:uncharacterized protein (TIGR00299 family) protein